MHASDILRLSQADPREALQKRVEELFSKPCPEIIMKSYTIPAKHFDQSYAVSASLLKLLGGKAENSCLDKVYEKGTFINATAINTERLFKNKLGNVDDIRKITNDYAIIDILQETSKLGIKIALSTHEYDKEKLPNGSVTFKTDQILLLHSTTAKEAEDGSIIKDKPMHMMQKLLAYCYVKGLIDDKDVADHRLNIGIHARPMEHFIKEFKKEGIERFSFMPEKTSELQLT